MARTFQAVPRKFIYVAIQGILAGGAIAQAHAGETLLPEIQIISDRLDPNGRLDLDTPIATGSKLGLTARETPATVTTVTRDQIEARGARDTQEIARGIPGVTNSSPPGSAGSVTYRGFSGGQITQLFNGISVQYDVIAARPIDSWIYDRVEAIGGPSSFLFGAGAVGGAINYVTKTAERNNFGEAQVRLGSFNSQQYSFGLNRQVGGSDARNGHFLRLDANSRLSDGWVNDNKSASLQVAASLLSDLGPNLTHTLALEFQKEHVDRPYWGTPLLVGAGNVVRGVGQILDGTERKNYNAVDGLYEQTIQWKRSVLEWKASDSVKVQNTLYAYDALRDYRNVEVYRFNATNTGVIRSSPLLQRHDQRLFGDRVEASLKSSLFGLPSDWAAGIDYSLNRQTRYPQSIAGNVNTVNPFSFTLQSYYAIPGTSPTYLPDRTVSVRTLSLSIENRTRLAPSLALVTAVRRDSIDMHLANHRAITAASPAAFDRRYSPTTGRAGLIWDITPHANVYVQYATAADPPSGILATAAFSDVINNNKLTTGKQAEVGSKFDYLEGKGSATVSAYRISRRNISTPDPLLPAVSILVGRQSARGVEVATGLRVTPQLTLQGNLAVVHAQYDDFSQVVSGVAVSRAGKVPTNTPRRIANLWGDYAFTPEWQAGIGARYVGEVYADVANTIIGPRYTVVDAGFSFRADKTLTLSGKIRNLGDKRYASSVTGTPMFYLGEPRALDITLKYAF